MLSSYPYNVDYEIGDLVMLAHSVEFMGMSSGVGELGIIIQVYDRRYTAKNIYDCRIVLRCRGELDCWFGELINLTKLS